MKKGRLFRSWWWLVLPLALLLVWLGGRLLDHRVKARLIEVGNEIAGEGYGFSIDRTHAHLFAGSIEVTGITLTYDSTVVHKLKTGNSGEAIRFSANKVHVRHVSYWDLLFSGEVHFVAVEIEGPEIHYAFRPAKQTAPENVVEEEEAAELPTLIQVDTLLVRSATGSTTDISSTRPAFNVGGLDIALYGAYLRSHRNGKVRFHTQGADIHAWDLSAELPPVYDLYITSIKIDHPNGRALIREPRLQPRYDEHTYGEHVEFETDLYRIEADSLIFLGIDVGRFMRHQQLHMERMLIRSPEAIIHRDKTMPDGPFVHKSLPVSGLRKLGIGLRIDTVEVSAGRVEYHEQAEGGNGFGMVAFEEIRGELTGLNNTNDTDSSSHLIATGTARIYDKSTVQMRYKASMASKNDAFTITARIGQLPFTVFNRMSDDLLQVKATEGRIHSMELNMHGNEWQGSGTVDLAYEDLKIDLKPNAEKWHEGKIANLLGNALVRRNNLPDRKNYRQGDFTTPRRRDRAIFNFIWQGIKTGTAGTLAPGILKRPVQDAARYDPNER